MILELHYKPSSKDDEYETPPELVKQLCEKYQIFPIIDVAATLENKKFFKYFTKDDDGLIQEWDKDCWCNHPHTMHKEFVEKAFNESGILPSDIDYINAHGTATVFNDEMESIAFSKSGLEKVPLNSLKGYYGHTLGTAGVLESVLTIRQLNQGLLFKSAGYLNNGISKKLKILTDNYQKDNMKYALKTASGFGGGNAAIIFKKLWN